MAILASAYDGSFDSAAFMILVPLTRPPIVQQETQYHKPTTDTNITIDMGKGLRNWAQKVALDAADLSTLEGKTGSTGTYVFCDGSISSVRLKAIDTPVKAPGFPVYEVTLQFSVDN